jgi:NTE family protein
VISSATRIPWKKREVPRVSTFALVSLGLMCTLAAGAPPQPPRATVGVAFGGGSARGIAHIGVIQWFEEHHIPIDMAAGTSMGGLVGGAFATGMSAAELRALITGTDWDVMFGSSSFGFKNLRRKEDARSYPSRLEFGLKKGLVAPTSLNDGQQVDFLLARITAPYFALERFDDLPTPFRVVAVDLKAAEKVVIDSGPLATALRATMSLPAIFPPVERDGKLLVDGGALDNIPADVVRAMGAATVIAIDVGETPDEDVNYSMFGLMGRTIDAMMRSATRAALASADMTIAIDVDGFGSLDWRRADELIARGYQAAESHRDELLKFQVPEDAWRAWLAARQGRRKTDIPQPVFITTTGVEPSDAALVQRAVAHHLNAPLDIPALERDLTALSGLDRYQAIDWRITRDARGIGLDVRAREKTYAPPFLMLGLNLENTTSENFRVQFAGRYLAFDRVGSGSELRVDAGIGADPSLAAALYKPIGDTALFVRGVGAASLRTFNFVRDDTVVAEYRERRLSAAADLGVNLSRESEVAGGLQVGHVIDEVRAGDPGLPELSGPEVRLHLGWVFDGQDSPVVPSRGTRASFSVSQTFDSPTAEGVERSNRNLTQAELNVSTFRSAGRRHRLFVVAAAGTSFDDTPLPTRQFTLGYPFTLDAFAVGEKRGDHYGVLTLGGLRQVARLPDFIGGPVFAGLWFENGTAFNTHQNADFHSQIAGGIMMETLVGPVVAGVSAGLDGGWRTLFGIGRVFR